MVCVHIPHVPFSAAYLPASVPAAGRQYAAIRRCAGRLRQHLDRRRVNGWASAGGHRLSSTSIRYVEPSKLGAKTVPAKIPARVTERLVKRNWHGISYRAKAVPAAVAILLAEQDQHGIVRGRAATRPCIRQPGAVECSCIHDQIVLRTGYDSPIEVPGRAYRNCLGHRRRCGDRRGRRCPHSPDAVGSTRLDRRDDYRRAGAAAGRRQARLLASSAPQITTPMERMIAAAVLPERRLPPAGSVPEAMLCGPCSRASVSCNASTCAARYLTRSSVDSVAERSTSNPCSRSSVRGPCTPGSPPSMCSALSGCAPRLSMLIHPFAISDWFSVERQ